MHGAGIDSSAAPSAFSRNRTFFSAPVQSQLKASTSSGDSDRRGLSVSNPNFASEPLLDELLDELEFLLLSLRNARRFSTELVDIGLSPANLTWKDRLAAHSESVRAVDFDEHSIESSCYLGRL